MAFNLDQQNNNANGGEFTLRFASNAQVKHGESFVPSVTAALTRITLTLRQKGTVTGNIWVTLEADSTGAPSGTPLDTSPNIDASTITATAGGQTVNFNFTGNYQMTSGVTYWLVLQGDYTFSADINNIKPQVSGSGVYTSGVFKVFDGTNWSTDQLFDLLFQEYRDNVAGGLLLGADI